MKQIEGETHYLLRKTFLPMTMSDLTPLIPGFYADSNGRLYLNMGEFLSAHNLPDAPEFRAVVWDEVQDVFAGVSIIEIFD